MTNPNPETTATAAERDEGVSRTLLNIALLCGCGRRPWGYIPSGGSEGPYEWTIIVGGDDGGDDFVVVCPDCRQSKLYYRPETLVEWAARKEESDFPF
jgi:hypothetical protein